MHSSRLAKQKNSLSEDEEPLRNETKFKPVTSSVAVTRLIFANAARAADSNKRGTGGLENTSARAENTKVERPKGQATRA